MNMLTKLLGWLAVRNSVDSPPSLQNSSSCYVLAIKKSGTHLIRNLLTELHLQPIDCLSLGSAAAIRPSPAPVCSFVFSLERPSIFWRGRCQNGEAKIIFNLRDPRAVFASLIDFYDWNRPLSSNLPTVEFRRAACRNLFKNREEMAIALIEDEMLDDDPFTPWLNFRRCRALYHNPMVLKVRFEEMVNSVRSPTNISDHPVTRICNYLNLNLPHNAGDLIHRAIAADSITKNIGDPNRWRRCLSPEILGAFMAKNGDIVREYGYPAD